MKFSTILLVSINCFIFFSCNEAPNLSLKTPKKINTDKKLSIELTDKSNNTIDSVHFFIDNILIKTSTESKIDISIEDQKLGERKITALAFIGNSSEKLSKKIFFLADERPVILRYKIINTYPHSKNAYTQGLEIHNGVLYESTGLRGKSTLRKVNLETGEVLLEKKLENKFFGEGITKFNDKIYMLTWQSKKGFIFDFENFEEQGSFKYDKSTQGWGLTNDGQRLIKSDGTEKIWFLNAQNQKEEEFIEAYTDKRKVENLNELEYINGKIFANVYLEDAVLIIEPKTGKIEAVLNLKNLKKEVQKTQQLKPRDEVLNGIAYDKKKNKLYVTGKNWGKLFEIEILEQ